MPKSPVAFSLDAEVRAVEAGHHSFYLGDDRYSVIAETGSCAHYEVLVLRLLTGHVWFACTCISGQHRPHLPVCCKHAALVGRRLERQHQARRVDDGWVQKDVDITERNGQD